MKFSVQEIGIYEKMVDHLKLYHEEQEQALIEAYKFVMENSTPVPAEQ